MRTLHPKIFLYLGIALILVALLGNKWLLGSLLARDGNVDTPAVLVAIFSFQLISIVAGIYLIIRRRQIRLPSARQAALLGLGGAFALGLAETAARAWLNTIASEKQFDRFCLFSDVPEKMRWSPHHYLSFVPTPNWRRGLASHNSLGFRGPEFSTKKPPGVFRIVAIGGSTTYTGFVDDNAKTYPALLEKVLRDDHGHSNVQVINAGVVSYNSWESLINLEFRVLDLEPDLVVVYHGTNDVHARIVPADLYRGDNAGRRKPWQPPSPPFWEHSALLRILSRGLGLTHQIGLETFVGASSYMGAAAQGGKTVPLDSTAILAENPPVYFQRNLSNMVAIARANGARIMLATWAYSPGFGDYASTRLYQEGFAETVQATLALGPQLDVPVFDFAAQMPQDPKYWADGRHVNEAGALLKARLFARFIHEQGLIDCK